MGVMAVDLRLLGPVELWIDELRIDVGPAKQRLVLSALAVDANHVVPIDQLLTRVWDEPPARDVVYTYVGNLRRALDEGRGFRIARRSGGYVLEGELDDIDLLRFRRLARQAREGGPRASYLLREALSAWRGLAFSGLSSQWIDAQRTACEQDRALVASELAEIQLREGDHEAVVHDLRALTSIHPLDERLVHPLMLALYRSGQQVEALECYQQCRRRLADELGIDPGVRLTELYARIVRHEEPLASPTVHTVPTRVGRPRQASGRRLLGRLPTRNAAAGLSRSYPRQLPAPPQMFTGRRMELADLGKIHDASTVVITAIDGMAGVGKTALAVQAAHQMADRYPDGQLFLDLHGYTEGVAPIEPGEALDRLLRSLGVAGEGIPSDLDQRAALYRSRLADKRMVIVLDNAATLAQVAPLLPGAPGCVVLVTSRRRLPGLDHTHALSLDSLPLPDAIGLLRQTAGESRLAGQPPESADELVELCGRLPLAIRIAAARLRSHPAWDLGHLVERLRDERHRLVELEAGQRGVTAALDLSYHDLSVDQQRTYRRLGLHPGPDIDVCAAGALLDATQEEAGRLLEQLLEAHLLQERTPGRYRFHDLIRAHANHTATRDETEHGGALDRLLDYYRHVAAVAMAAAYPFERERRPQVPDARDAGPDLSDPAEALAWLDTELPNLLAAARFAAEHDRPTHLLHLSSILQRHLRTRSAYHNAETLYQHAMDAAHTTGQTAAEAEALVGLGRIHRALGRPEQASDHFEQALRLARATGHHVAELDALNGLGHVYRAQGRHAQAIDHYQRALQLARATGDHAGEQEALTSLGHMHRTEGRYRYAADQYQRALQLARAAGHRNGELDALIGLGLLHQGRGQYQQAADHYQQALELAHTTGYQVAAHAALLGLGDIHRILGRHGPSGTHYERLLVLARESGNRNYQFEAWQGLGRLHHVTGHPDAALTHHNQALALATELDQPGDQARAHDGLARAHHALHQQEQARTHWQHALDMLANIGVDGVDEETTLAAIRAHLDNLGDHGVTHGGSSDHQAV
jgi:DNA-binding SARP family transcriptional activator/Tfp pilus assembly protein PilF